VLEAQVKFDAASTLADAEVTRARGVAQAKQIIGQTLKPKITVVQKQQAMQ
jgi:hypothetical protein